MTQEELDRLNELCEKKKKFNFSYGISSFTFGENTSPLLSQAIENRKAYEEINAELNTAIPLLITEVKRLKEKIYTEEQVYIANDLSMEELKIENTQLKAEIEALQEDLKQWKGTVDLLLLDGDEVRKISVKQQSEIEKRDRAIEKLKEQRNSYLKGYEILSIYEKNDVWLKDDKEIQAILEGEQNEKPARFSLNDQLAHFLECGDGKDAELIYLKPDSKTYLYVGKLRKLKALRSWLDKSIAYLESKKR